MQDHLGGTADVFKVGVQLEEDSEEEGRSREQPGTFLHPRGIRKATLLGTAVHYGKNWSYPGQVGQEEFI